MNNNMSELTVDSRLIAEELGIEHRTLKETIRNYEAQLSNSAEVRSETLKGKSLPQGGFARSEVIKTKMESSIEFSQKLAVALYESTEKFPVDLELAYIWLGYARKDSAKRKLANNFIEGVDFELHRSVETISSNDSSSKEQINLTVGCFKELGMLAGTEQGKKVRKYFIECEKIAKKVTEDISPALLECLNNMQKEMRLLSARTLRLDAIDSATNNNKGIKGVIDTEVEEIYPSNLAYTVREYLEKKGVSDEHLNTMRKRAVMFANQGKQTNLPRKGNEYVFRGNDISYLDQALKTVLGLD